jgi:hypothetical protein
VHTCAFGTIFRRNSVELKAGKKCSIFLTKGEKKSKKAGKRKKNLKKVKKRHKKCIGFLNTELIVVRRAYRVLRGE